MTSSILEMKITPSDMDAFFSTSIRPEVDPRVLSADERARFEAGEAVARTPKRDGTNHCTAFHPEAYVRSTLARSFEVVEVQPDAAPGNPTQDVYLLQKP